MNTTLGYKRQLNNPLPTAISPDLAQNSGKLVKIITLFFLIFRNFDLKPEKFRDDKGYSTASKKTSKAKTGFTLIELLIATFVIGTALTGIFGLFLLSLRLAQESERRLVAIALANERMEKVRNLPYVDVGTSGGVPSGSIVQEEVVVRNNVSYTVKTDIRYVDDIFDGVTGGGAGGGCLAVAHEPAGQPENCQDLCVGSSSVNAHIQHGDSLGDCAGGSSGVDVLNTDYKQVRVEVSWPSPNSPKPILLITKITPEGVEGGELFGTWQSRSFCFKKHIIQIFY